MALITHKKPTYSLSTAFRGYLRSYQRLHDLPVRYRDLRRYAQTIPLYDAAGRDTLWSTVVYDSGMEELHEGLRRIYAELKTAGDEHTLRHLFIERIDMCEFGNTMPFRVKIVNRFNENFDYFYLKQADANRVYGLELEHLLSPNRINFIVDEHTETLVEEHVPGIPGEVFIRDHLEARYLNPVRLAKEFVKFNERCFIRLLGDMHMHNFVVEVTPDFENTIYRLRAIDFDQQSHEGNRKVYLPQFHKENNPIIQLGMDMAVEARRQYQREERAVIRYRIQSQRPQLDELLAVMEADIIAPDDNVQRLRSELAQHYNYAPFERAQRMGAILRTSLDMLFTDTHGQVALP